MPRSLLRVRLSYQMVRFFGSASTSASRPLRAWLTPPGLIPRRPASFERMAHAFTLRTAGTGNRPGVARRESYVVTTGTGSGKLSRQAPSPAPRHLAKKKKPLPPGRSGIQDRRLPQAAISSDCAGDRALASRGASNRGRTSIMPRSGRDLTSNDRLGEEVTWILCRGACLAAGVACQRRTLVDLRQHTTPNERNSPRSGPGIRPPFNCDGPPPSPACCSVIANVDDDVESEADRVALVACPKRSLHARGRVDCRTLLLGSERGRQCACSGIRRREACRGRPRAGVAERSSAMARCVCRRGCSLCRRVST